ncbi:MAG TPA: hypothetical protein VGE15_11635 [Sphingobacteriaceae bacterium]
MKISFRSPLFICIMWLYLPITPANGQIQDRLQGAWKSATGGVQEILLLQDGYLTHTTYDPAGKKFLMTRGGPFSFGGKEISLLYEFHSSRPEETGSRQNWTYSVKNDILVLNIDGKEQEWIRVDDSSGPLAGVWKISDRMEGGELVKIHQRGTRKTLKLLTGTRFQWFAIDPGTKMFAGTGGGTYSFDGGKYVENIEFFSRDNSRVGARLTFDGKLENGKWHHSGSGSKGDTIYEVWSRVYPGKP